MQQSLFTGAALSEIGQQIAIDNADRVNLGWSEMAYQHLLNFIALYGNEPFKAEEARCYALIEGLPQPPSERSWGALITKAKKQGIIKKIGIGPVTNPDAHQANAGTWIKAN